MNKCITITVILLILNGCAQIQHYTHFSKPVETLQIASIGTELYRITKTRDLPNAFGKADIWGGKVDEGYTELRYMGLTKEGKIVFRLTDADILSNESVFTRYGASRTVINSNTSANVTVNGATAYGNANSNSTVTHIEKTKATITQLPPNKVEFKFDPTQKSLTLENVIVEVVDVKEHSISYILRKSN